MKITSADHVRLMIPFLKGLPDAIRIHEPSGLAYYGTGEAAHWAVQCNQQVLCALAILAAEPDLEQYKPAMTAEELRKLALSMFRYSLRTHATGDMVCTDGKQWGRHWISVLGLERAVSGINALEPYFTDDDRERYKKLRIYEADYRLNEYPVRAGMDASKGANVPESNIWNAGFLMRTALDYPDLPQAEAYLEKATAMMLNGISVPADAESQEVFNGKTVAEWYVGPNFTENYSLDHHGYMNMGYSFTCLSNLAYLYFNFRERGQQIPPEIMHHARDLWERVKLFMFPDGRLIRIGGDTRVRYAYCQCFALSVCVFAADAFHDPDAVRFEKNYLAVMEKEQKQNPDGSFFGKRLSGLKDYSYYYYRRIEADPIHALATCAYWRRLFQIPDTADDAKPAPAFWQDDFHDAMLLRTERTVRSVVRRAEHSQEVLCLPLYRSDMAEWYLNLTGYIGCHYMNETGPAVRHAFKDGFTYARKTEVFERAPIGEGEEQYHVANREYACAALPDGRTMLIFERVTMTKENTFTFGYRSLHCSIPNDVYNDFKRSWVNGEGKCFETRNLHGTDDLLDTASRKVNCDNALSFFSLSGDTLKIKRSAKQNVFLQCGLWGMYADEVCMKADLKPVRLKSGEVMYDIACAVAADTSADQMATHPDGAMETLGNGLRLIRFTGFDSCEYEFLVNFTAEPQEYASVTIPAADVQLFCNGAPFCR